MIKSILSCRLRRLRKEAGLTQEDVARHLNIERQTYCNYENDFRTPPLQTIVRMADFYQITVDELVREEVPAAPPLTDTDHTLSVTEESLLKTFRMLPSPSQREVLEFVQFKSDLISDHNK